MLLPRAQFVPEGLVRISPAFQRWVSAVGASSPEGTAECGCWSQPSQPSLLDLFLCSSQSSVETLGYFRLSLRDNDAKVPLEITSRQGSVQQSFRPYLNAIRLPPTLLGRSKRRRVL